MAVRPGWPSCCPLVFEAINPRELARRGMRALDAILMLRAWMTIALGFPGFHIEPHSRFLENIHRINRLDRIFDDKGPHLREYL